MGRPSPGRITSLAGLPDDQQITLNDVASVLCLHYSTAYELVCGGAIPFLRHGKAAIRVEVGELRKYIDSRRVAARRDPLYFINVRKAG